MNDGGPAFPRPASVDPRSGTLPDGDRVIDPQGGMSLRDYFAGRALAGIMANPHMIDTIRKIAEEDQVKNVFVLSASCYDYADGMLKARGE